MRAALERNLRLYPWFLAFSYESFSNAVWYLYLFSYKGLGLLEMAWLTLLGDGVIALCEVPTGWLADRLGRRWSMLTGVLLQIASFLLFIYGDSFIAFWLAMAVCGLGDTFRNGADQALLYDSALALDQSGRFRHLVAHGTFVATSVYCLAGIAGGVLATRVNWYLPFWCDIGFSLVALAIVLRMREAPMEGARASSPYPGSADSSQEKEGERDGPQVRARLKEGERDGPQVRAPLKEEERDGPQVRAPLKEEERDGPQVRARLKEGERDGPQVRAPLKEEERDGPQVRAPLKEEERDGPQVRAPLRVIMPVLLLAMVFTVTPELSHFHLPAELEGGIALTPELLAYLYAGFELLQALGAKLGGSPRWHGLRTLAGGTLAMALLLALFGLRGLGGMPLLIAYLVTRGAVDLLYGLAEPLLAEELNRRVESRVRATAISWLNAVRHVVPLALLPLSAQYVEHAGFSKMYWVFGAAMLPLALVSGWWLFRSASARQVPGARC